MDEDGFSAILKPSPEILQGSGRLTISCSHYLERPAFNRWHLSPTSVKAALIIFVDNDAKNVDITQESRRLIPARRSAICYRAWDPAPDYSDWAHIGREGGN